ncbi:MAG: hypothetical protein ACLRXQ_03160 [Phascolarctobacterium faecium]
MIIVNLYIDGGSYVYTHKNAHIYAPADTGCQDLLLAGRKIVHMAPSIGELPLTAPLLTSAG